MSEDPTKLLKDDFDAIMKFLHRERDELRVKIHLAKAEAKEEWQELEEKWHFASLEKIFIENRIYREIEECETWEAVIETIDKGAANGCLWHSTLQNFWRKSCLN